MEQHQLDFDFASRERDAAIAAVSERAEQEDTWDAEAVAEWVLGYLRQYGPTGSEAITLAAKRAGHVPHDDRAFGGIYSRLVRRKLIEKRGMQMQRTRGHLTHGGFVWAATGGTDD